MKRVMFLMIAVLAIGLLIACGGGNEEIESEELPVSAPTSTPEPLPESAPSSIPEPQSELSNLEAIHNLVESIRREGLNDDYRFELRTDIAEHGEHILTIIFTNDVFDANIFTHMFTMGLHMQLGVHRILAFLQHEDLWGDWGAIGFLWFFTETSPQPLLSIGFRLNDIADINLGALTTIDAMPILLERTILLESHEAFYNTFNPNGESQMVAPSPDTIADTSVYNILSFGSTFEFDGFEVTIGATWEVVTVANRFSDFNGHDAIRVLIEITNTGNETATLRNPAFYGPDGIRLDSINTLFRDYQPQSMRPGATATAYLHFLYVDDGEYWAVFSRVRERIEISLPIAR
ncbi:MAG: hypothetical protein FWE11_09125 [Defluviitaleaceae bacterium]|nr:hypothetical protein [Defluviitaleaceae bacterium]